MSLAAPVVGSAARNVVALASRAPELETERFRRLLVHRLLPELKLDKPPMDELRHLHKVEREKAYLLSHWEQEEKDRRFLVVVWHDVPRIVHDVFPELYSDVQQSRVNVVDAENLRIGAPEGHSDLPAGGKRYVQHATGYRATLVAGEVVMENGERTGALPGRLVRGAQPAPA